MANWSNICFVAITSIAIITQVLLPAFRGPLYHLDKDLAHWLTENRFEYWASKLIKSGHVRLIDVVELVPYSDMSQSEKQRFNEQKYKLKQALIFNHWLREHDMASISSRFRNAEISSFQALMDSPFKALDCVRGNQHNNLKILMERFPKDKELMEEMTDGIWVEMARIYGLPSSKTWWRYIKVVILVVAVGILFTVAAFVRNALWVMTRSSSQKHTLLNLFTGKYLHPQRCSALFLWTDPVYVGTTVAFLVQFFQRNGKPYPISNADGVVIEITHGIHKVGLVTELGGESGSEANSARCKFTARRAGVYSISVLVANQHIKGSPFLRKFLPGPADPNKITVVQHTSTVVCKTGKSHHILVEPRDSYLNLCIFTKDTIDLLNYSIHIKELEGGWAVDAAPKITYDDITRRIDVEVTLHHPGCYSVCIAYSGDPIINGKFELIVLTADEMLKVGKASSRRSSDGYEARLLSSSPNFPNISSPSEPIAPSKPKKVYCFVTPKQLIIKEYLLRVIPKRLATFRLCPSTKLYFDGTDRNSGAPILRIDDGCQPPVILSCEERNVVASTFSQFMLKNIGGSETFKDKQEHFAHAVRKLHSKKAHDRLPIFINRNKLLESAMKATKYFSVADWCKNFEVTFVGEEGMDWGGLRREFFELISASLFDPANQLFTSFYEGPEAPVHPNPNRPKHLKLKHYEFAGRVVGKCLYESALGGGYRLSVKARFTRSFLAQLIGLRVHYKHFSHDDPDLYSGKVDHLLTQGTKLLDDPLYFVDDVIVDGECKVMELESGGSSKLVTDQNVTQYLDSLAQSRLCSRVRFEIDAFMGGLNEIIPDNLLCIFDETELELLMCGIEVYSIADMKANHVVNGSSDDFSRVLYWFWTAVSNFTDEEMARLLQFTTGCSRLPPGGFSQLSPHFQICPSHTYGNLPSAHTCFNQLCLPDYDSYESFEKAILFAIKEGSEGFGII